MKLATRLFEHIGLSFALAMLALLTAIALAWVTQWAEARHMPAYLLQGMHYIGILLLASDIFFVVSASIIMAVAMMKKLLREDL